MKYVAMILASVLAVHVSCAAEPAVPVARWTFDEPSGPAGTVKGTPETVPGVEGKAWRFDGAVLSVPSSPALQFVDATFSLSAWVNPYELGSGQQMILCKNVYSANQREWGLMIDRDRRFHFYVSNKGWKAIGGQTEPTPGHWHHVAVTVDNGLARLYVNGKLEAQGMLAPSISRTDAPVTIGGTINGSHLMQEFWGAIDEVAIYRGVLAPSAILAMADKTTTPHRIENARGEELWAGGPVPKVADLQTVAGVRVSLIKPSQAGVELPTGWKKGVHLAWHKNRLYASFGFNKLEHIQGENTKGEEAIYLTSADGGETWSDVVAIASGEGELGVSHGVFLSHRGTLWSFNGAFIGNINAGTVHTRAYALNDTSGKWEPRGTVVEKGFWPLQEPIKMANGNWIMTGARVGDGNPAAVAISHGDDLTKWDLVVIPKAPRKMWGESAVLLDGRRIVNIARYGAQAVALAAVSENFGRTWTPSRPSNLPMTTSRPFAGALSNGQRYLICTTTADSGTKRAPLTIAVSRPGEMKFCRILKIEDGVGTYPAAAEHEGMLYVGWTGGSMAPRLACIPISSLAISNKEK